MKKKNKCENCNNIGMIKCLNCGVRFCKKCVKEKEGKYYCNDCYYMEFEKK